jgi:argininosuccinate lyase
MNEIALGSDDRFPAPVYARTVLAPLFDLARTRFVDAFRRVDRAQCVMLAEQGLLTPAQARAIARALADIERELDLSTATYTGEVEDLFFLIEHALAARLDADTNGRLHTGRSRNDMDHTVFRMVLKQHADRLAASGRALADALIRKAQTERDTIIVAYTHGQPAQPSTFGHYLAAAIEVLLADLERLAAARRVLDQCPMGAAAITTTGFALSRERMAALLGFSAIRVNSYGAIATVDYVTAPCAAAELMALHLGRVAQDMQAWSAFEVRQLHVPDGFVQISSIMPQKRNPVPIEHARLLLSLAAGRARTAIGTMHNTPFTDMNDAEAEVQAAAHAAFTDGSRALDLLAALIPACRIDADRVAANIDRSCCTITELADTLVREEGLSFRQAHGIAAATARAVVDAGTSLPAGGHAPFARAFHAATGRPAALDEQRFRTVVSPAHFVAVRQRPGGPAAGPMDHALAACRTALDALAAEAEGAARREATQHAALDAAFAALLQ